MEKRNDIDSLRQNDRISLSIGRKINLGNFESYDFHVSFSSDIDPGEGKREAYKRVRRQVKVWADGEEYNAIRLRDKGKSPPPGLNDEASFL